MSTPKDSETSSKLASNPVNGSPGLSLDWWAVIFALALVVLVLAGLQVNW